MKIYISGKITGIEDVAPTLFKAAENRIKEQGHEPVNPMDLNHDHDKSWHSYMKADIKALCDCDAIYMLDNWMDSKGAMIEHAIANTMGLEVIYQQYGKFIGIITCDEISIDKAKAIQMIMAK